MQDEVLELVRGAIDELNEELQYDTLRNPTADTRVFGGDDGIDSLTLVTLIVQLEQAVSQKFGKHVTLADEKAMSARNSPFRTVGALATLISTQLGHAQ